MISCDLAVTLPSAPALTTSVPGAVETIVFQTAAVAGAQTASLLPPTATFTSTPLPTRTASATPTFTPTFIIRIGPRVSSSTAVPTDLTQSSGDLGCKLLSQSPADGSHFAPKENFSVSWRVRNTGSADWKASSVDFAYISGAKIHETGLYDLINNVRVDATVNLVVDMIAPKNSGTYTTIWALRQNSVEFCHVDLKIHVP